MIMQPAGSQARRVRFWRISPSSRSLRRTRHVSGLAGSVGLGLQYVRVSRAEEMRRGVRGGRSEGRFTRGSTRPLIRQDARGERSQKTCETRNKKVALDQAQEPRAKAQCGTLISPSIIVGGRRPTCSASCKTIASLGANTHAMILYTAFGILFGPADFPRGRFSRVC